MGISGEKHPGAQGYKQNNTWRRGGIDRSGYDTRIPFGYGLSGYQSSRIRERMRGSLIRRNDDVWKLPHGYHPYVSGNPRMRGTLRDEQ